MTDPLITPVILCGGAGTRLWPLSRQSYPKQFSSLTGPHSMFQDCALRSTGPHFAPPLIVAADAHRFTVAQQLSAVDVQEAAILIEPAPRDTAPAILAAALYLAQSDPDGLMLVSPSDHAIPDAAAFQMRVATAVPAAVSGQIVTFGVIPDRPETGYGYLEVADPGDATKGPWPLRQFIEKPDAEGAWMMLASGRYLWNAGLYLFTARTILAAYAKAQSEMLRAVKKAIAEGAEDLSFFRLASPSWTKIKPVSIDYAIMEGAENLCVMPLDTAWSDMGDWAAVWRETHRDGVATTGEATAIDCTDTLLRSEVAGQAIVGVGLENIVAVAMPDAVLISDKNRTQDVKIAVQSLQEKGVPQADIFPRDHRPWGWFESLAIGDRFQVKRIVVNPGAALSLQSHMHRSEHWIVVQGTARVTVGTKVQLVTENQSIYVPLGARHRLENPGKMPMVLIEVQTGAYLGEDDITRHEDIYARG